MAKKKKQISTKEINKPAFHGQNGRDIENQKLNELSKFVDAQFAEDLPLDATELNQFLEILGERFEIKQLIANHFRDWLYYAVYRITNWPVTIQITRFPYVYEKATNWQKLEVDGIKIEKIIEVGKLDSGYFYIISEISAHPDMKLLKSGWEMSSQQAIDLVRDLCDVVAKFHSHGIFHCEIDPFSVVYLPQNGSATLHALRRPFFRNVLGLSLNDNDKTGAIRRDANEIEIQSVAYQANLVDIDLLPRLIRDLLISHPLNGWMYALLNPFIAPECVWGIGDERADVYSLGALLYWLLVGEPHINIREELEAQRLTNGQLPDNIDGRHILKLLLEPLYSVKLMGFKDKIDKMPVEISSILLKTLEGSPDNRYRNSLSLGEALDHITLNSFTLSVLTGKGNAVKGANVTLTKNKSQDHFSAQTDKNGKVHFKKLFSGIYEIKVDHKDYQSPRIPPTLIHIGSPSKTVEVKLEPVGLINRLFNSGKER